MNADSRTATREVSVAGHCMQAGDDALGVARSYDGSPSQRTASCMCALSMYAFALEADVNHLLQRLVDSRPALLPGDTLLEDVYWKTLRERIDMFFRLLGKQAPDFGSRPFQVAGTLKDFRDAIVHGKPHIAEIEDVPVVNGQLTRIPRALLAGWETECTIERVERHRKDIVDVHGSMIDAADGSLGSPIGFTAVLGLGRTGHIDPTAPI